MQDLADIAEFLARQPQIRRALGIVEGLELNDCWIGAGLVRNAVWDHFHGLPMGLAPGADVDVVYFASASVDPSKDGLVEQHLRTIAADLPWSVRNQARMHTRNGDPPYRNTADAVRCWPETATAIAARLQR